ncbi:ATP-dependent Clp protease adaptor protein ClpS [Saccharopolyspora kobensis]|uniref:ATP-dependent Clp protease adaptor protein ClpS n=1 Tax=Saccharopolyspora kobensis TaxID=146035 RepID=A0A1H5W8U9_9PSEU|nr:ATP-dependent Clp protease adaptor protein ClpS [Saccharopolyspora kobensis]SFD72925.1 ATP-dependent Clp protease adaptor protein ClpS [Saccharopolyspora kobensis]
MHNDDSQSALLAAFVLRELCALEIPEAGRLAQEIEAEGVAQVGRFPDQAQAEDLVVALQRHGLHGAVRPL